MPPMSPGALLTSVLPVSADATALPAKITVPRSPGQQTTTTSQEPQGIGSCREAPQHPTGQRAQLADTHLGCLHYRNSSSPVLSPVRVDRGNTFRMAIPPWPGTRRRLVRLHRWHGLRYALDGGPSGAFSMAKQAVGLRVTFALWHKGPGGSTDEYAELRSQADLHSPEAAR
jgi:hypothetical protein